MTHYLLDEREQKRIALAEKESELTRLRAELETLQDKSQQVKIIEETLAAAYAERQQKFPIDRSQESEISSTISEKNIDIKYALDKYHFAIDQKPVYTWDKERMRSYNAACKAAGKSCLTELKRVFGELDIDLRRFYKNGISAENLRQILEVMDKICGEGAKIGTIPLSYQQKIYKWKLIAKEIPEDEEKKEKKKEKEALKTKQLALANAKEKVSKYQKAIMAIKRKRTIEKKSLTELSSELLNIEGLYPEKKKELITEAASRKQVLQIKAEKRDASIRREYERKKRELNAAIEKLQLKIAGNQEKIEQFEKEKGESDAAFGNTFILSFGKKRALKEKSLGLEKTIENIKKEVFDQNQQLEELLQKRPETEMQKKIRRNEENLNEVIAEVDNETEANLKELTDTLSVAKQNVATAEACINLLNGELDSKQKLVLAEQENVSKLEQDIEGFHVKYMIKTYGKQVGIQSMISDKKSEIREVTSTIKTLKKEITVLDKVSEREEKEKARKHEAQRKEGLKRAQEEARIKKEHEELKQRIHKELLDQEAEQEVINTKAHSLEHIPKTVHELEANSEHPLLQEENGPIVSSDKSVITNSIVRKRFVQVKSTPDCSQYMLMFVDHNGKVVSEQRLLDQKRIGERTSVSFELKTEGGFDRENYYLLIMDFNTGDVLGASKYKINISFANDFGF